MNDVSKSLDHHLTYSLAKDAYSATRRDKLHAVILAARDLVVKNWMLTQEHYYDVDPKRVYYLSMEYLLGRLLMSTLISTQMVEAFREGVETLGITLDEIVEEEWDAGLGNGGLGRLAACYIDSLATLDYPAYGYGIRYEYGIFFQRIQDGYQVETPDNWLRYGNLWEFPRPEILQLVNFYGRVMPLAGSDGKSRMAWLDTDRVLAMAYDTPVPGFRTNTVNTLRLWAAKSTREFDLAYFNSGDYVRAIEQKGRTESISRVLYPNDESTAGKELRLKQQYFFVAATLKDIIRRYKKAHETFHAFPDKVAIQLNDTHPTIAIPELMRILVDEEGFAWDDAWAIVTKIFAYTNHTILPEALEKWSVDLMENLLPRHMQIIREIDRRFQIQVSRRFPGEEDVADRTTIVEEGEGARVHMARLAIAGSHTVNGVSRLHSNILTKSIFADFHAMEPEKFTNVTNGVTPRRWLMEANPALADLITRSIGNEWQNDFNHLVHLEPFSGQQAFIKNFLAVKEANKAALSACLDNYFNVSFPVDSILDCQIKRFHEYKRQLLNIFHAITLYNRVIAGTHDPSLPHRTILFAGKSAPGYAICKLIIKFIHCVKEVVEAHPEARKALTLLFIPNYSVSVAQKIIPAADLSEQISTAGYEASGTGNMKFALNGALTIGTLDGANVEIRHRVGEENFFLFGLKADEVEALRADYNPSRHVERSSELSRIVEQIDTGFFSPEEPDLFKPIVRRLLDDGDPFMVMADYESYIACQERVARTYLEREKWARMAILNIARSGIFSSDRAVTTYAEEIWHATPAPRKPKA